jgi:hypothetical protein
VIVIELWPRRSDITLGWMCAASPSVAWVWRRSWKRMRGSPDLRTSRSTEKVKAGKVYKDEDLVFCRADGSRLDPDVVSGMTETSLRSSEVYGSLRRT